MYILAVDDEKLARTALTMALEQLFEKEDIYSFGMASECVAFVKQLREEGKQVDYAFLDIQLRGTTGIALAKEIKELAPATKVIFVTAYNDYASEAFSVQANGYLLKPVEADAIRKVLDTLQTSTSEQLEQSKSARVEAITFGKFAVFVDKKELVFERTKSKELLALLLDKRGAGLSNGDIEMYLWEDSLGEKRKNSYVQKVISSMMKTLRQAGAEDIVEKHYNHLAIRPEKIQCDLYDFLKGDARAVNSYYGVYLEDYSWAEFTNGMLEQWKQ